MFAGTSFSRALREAAPGLSRRFFRCHCQPIRLQQLNAEARAAFRRADTSSRVSSTPRPSLNTRLSKGLEIKCIRSFTASTKSRLADTAAAATQAVRKSRWPETSSNIVAYWLLGSAASVFGIVVFGGLTRLTESGCVYPPPRPLRLLTTSLVFL